MRFEELYKIARRNWIVKLVCFVLAVFIYFFYRVATLQDKTLVVPLQVSANGLMMPAENTPTHVKVSVKGRPQDLSRIGEQNIATYLNLDYYTESGEYDVPIEIIPSPDIMTINPLSISVENGSVRLAIAPKARAQVPVTADLQGNPESGYEVVDVSVTPSTIGVFGVETLLESMDSIVTEQIQVDGRTAPFSQAVAIHRDNSLVTYDDDSVKVSVDIQPITMTRRIVDQTVYLYGVNPLFAAHADPQMITFTLKGNQNQLGSFVPELHTVRLDCSAITEPGTYVLPVEVVLPNGIRLISQSDRTATVSIVPAGEETEVDKVVEVIEEIGVAEQIDIEVTEEGKKENSDVAGETDSSDQGEPGTLVSETKVSETKVSETKVSENLGSQEEAGL